MEFSWFYLDLICEDDLNLVVIFYRHPFFLTFDIVLIDVSIYRKGRKQHFGFPVPTDESSFCEKPLLVETPDGSLSFVKDECKLVLDNQSLKMNLQLRPCFHLWEPDMISLLKNGDRFFNWKVLIPQATVEGSIKIGGEEMQLAGRGYLDYNEGNFPLNRQLSSWYWGRLHSAESSLIFGSLRSEDVSTYSPLLWINHEGAHLVEVKNGGLNDRNLLELSPIGVNNRLRIETKKTLDKVNFLISPISVQLKFPRKVHEFIFYRLEETAWGKKINRFLANVKYERHLLSAWDDNNLQYRGLGEYIDFQ